MEFRLDDDQVGLQQTVARFFQDRFPLDAIHEREGAPVDRETWTALADLGTFGLLVDAADGGSGLGVVEAALVFEQVGSHLVPGPLMWSVLAASVLGQPLREQLVGGSLAATGVEGTAGDVLVEDVAGADLVLAIGIDTVAVHRIDDLVDVEPLEPLDPLTSVARVGSLGAGDAVGDQEAADRLRLVGSVLAAAELVGVASRALEVARAYALEREQFGAPIGSFQAVKHMLADMYVNVTLAQSATYAAAAVVDRPGPGDDPAASADAALLLAVDAAIDGSSTAVQVLGGMGFTWDMLPNHLLKRAWHVSHRFGPADARAERLGAQLVGAVTGGTSR